MRRHLTVLAVLVAAFASAEIRDRPPTGLQRPPIGRTAVRPGGTGIPLPIPGVPCDLCPCYHNEPPSTQYTMTFAGIEAWKATCSGTFSKSCPGSRLIQGFCVAGGTATNIGSWQSKTATCEALYTDPISGDPVTLTLAVNAAQKACCDIVVNYYCP